LYGRLDSDAAGRIEIRPTLNDEKSPQNHRLRSALGGALLLLCAAVCARALSVVASYPVAIQNNQVSSGTYQQSVTWNPSLFSSLESPDLGNVRFCADAACSLPLYAWLEGCGGVGLGPCTPSVSSATAWVKLTGLVVPSNGVSTIYIGFMATSNDFDVNYWGESIDITPGFDNGSNVFLYYNNGQSTASFTMVNGGSITDSVQTNPLGVSTNVITITGSGVTTNSQENVAWYNNPISGNNVVAEGWINIGPTNNAALYNQNCMFAYRGASNMTLTDYLEGIGWSGTFLGIAYESGTTNTYLGTGGGTRQNGWFWSYTTIYGNSLTASVWSEQPELGGVQASTITVTDLTLPTTNQYMGLGVWAGANAPAFFYQWRVRTLPPSGVISTATVSVPPASCFGQLITNSSTTASTPYPFQQALTLNPTSYAAIERADLGNIRFCADSQCQTPLNAWLEGCNGAGNGSCTPASSSATVWVDLPSSISPGGTLTIYECFVSTSVGFDGYYWGESVDISTNGDNGQYVFPYYNNGRSTNNLSLTNGGTLTTSNIANPYGVTTSSVIALTSKNTPATGETVAWSTGPVLGDNMVIEGWVDRGTNRSAMLAARGASSGTLTNYALGLGWGGNSTSEASVAYLNANSSTTLAFSGTYPAAGAGWYWSQGIIAGSQLNDAIFNKPPSLGGIQLATTTVLNAAVPNTNLYVGIADASNAAAPAYFYEWRVRNYYPGTGVAVDTSAPSAVTSLSAAPLSTSAAALSWSAPSDANYNPLSGKYAIQYSSLTTGVVWSTANAQVSITTSGVTPGAAQGAFVSGLNANTTYYFYLWTQDPALNWSSLSNGATTVTLANPVNAATGLPLSITASSVTVKWAALPATPQASTCEGYELEVSTTNFASGTVYSSTTFSELASTLAVAGLNTGTTMYLRVATLNWSGALNDVSLSSANIQISPSIATLVMGLDSTIQFSTVSASSVVVTNVGNLPLTLVVSGSTITAGSPWVLSISSAVEAPILQGEWNSAQPASASFTTAITNTPVSSAGGNYSGGQSGQAVPAGGSVTMWFKFWAPTSTTAGNTQEAIQVLYQAVYP